MVAKCSDYATVYDEEELLNAVVTVGPISIGVTVTKDFMLYKEG